MDFIIANETLDYVMGYYTSYTNALFFIFV